MKVTWQRVTAAVVVSVTAFAMLGTVGLWGVAFAAPVLLFAPSAVKGAVAERRTKKALDAELGVILGRTGGTRG